MPKKMLKKSLAHLKKKASALKSEATRNWNTILKAASDLGFGNSESVKKDLTPKDAVKKKTAKPAGKAARKPTSNKKPSNKKPTSSKLRKLNQKS